jgi:hypothetical protein
MSSDEVTRDPEAALSKQLPSARPFLLRRTLSHLRLAPAPHRRVLRLTPMLIRESGYTQWHNLPAALLRIVVLEG